MILVEVSLVQIPLWNKILKPHLWNLQFRYVNGITFHLAANDARQQSQRSAVPESSRAYAIPPAIPQYSSVPTSMESAFRPTLDPSSSRVRFESGYYPVNPPNGAYFPSQDESATRLPKIFLRAAPDPEVAPDDQIQQQGRNLDGDPSFDEGPPGKLCCSNCSASFTGQYRKSNLRRHLKACLAEDSTPKHGTTCKFCLRLFKRSDARKKHEWRIHDAHEARPKWRYHL